MGRWIEAKAEGEPVVNGVGHGVPVASDDEPILVLTEQLLELALCLRFCPATRSLEDPLLAGGVPDRD